MNNFPDTLERRTLLIYCSELNYLGSPFQMAAPPPGGRLIFKDAFPCEPAQFFTRVCTRLKIFQSNHRWQFVASQVELSSPLSLKASSISRNGSFVCFLLSPF